MSELKRVGFFREMSPGEQNLPSMVPLIGQTPQPDEDLILAYLRAGWLYVMDERGAVTLVNTSRGQPVQVAAVMTRGQRHEVVSPVAVQPIH